MTAVAEVRHLNLRRSNPNLPSAIATLVRGEPCSASVNEGVTAAALLADVKGYRVHRSEHGAMRRGYHDTQVLVRDDLESIGELALKVSDLVPAASRVAPDRWVTAAAYESPIGPLMHVSFHPDAGPEQLRTGVDTRLTREYAASIERVEALIRLARAFDLEVVLSADFNIREPWPDQPWDPYRMLERVGLRERFTHDLDTIACSGGLSIVNPTTVIVRGSDHRMIRAGLRRRRTP